MASVVARGEGSPMPTYPSRLFKALKIKLAS